MPITEPSGISGLVRWWRATEGLVTEMGGVVGWSDRVAGVVLEQPLIAERPQVVPSTAAAAGGVTAIDFSGTDLTWLRNTNALPAPNGLAQQFTIFAVALSRDNGRVTTLVHTQVPNSTTVGNELSSSFNPIRWRVFSGGIVTAPAGNYPSPAVRGLIAAHHAGTGTRIIANGVRSPTGSGGNRSVARDLNLGRDPNDASRPWNGLLWEFGFYSKLLNDNELSQLSTYAQDRYNLSPTVADYSRPVAVRAPGIAAASATETSTRTATTRGPAGPTARTSSASVRRSIARAAVQAGASSASQAVKAVTTVGRLAATAGTASSTSRSLAVVGTANFTARCATTSRRAVELLSQAGQRAYASSATNRTTTSVAITSVDMRIRSGAQRLSTVVAALELSAVTAVASFRPHVVRAALAAAAKASAAKAAAASVAVRSPAGVSARTDISSARPMVSRAAAGMTGVAAQSSERRAELRAAVLQDMRIVGARLVSVALRPASAGATASARTGRVAAVLVRARAEAEGFTGGLLTTRAAAVLADLAASGFAFARRYIRPLPPDTDDDIQVLVAPLERSRAGKVVDLSWQAVVDDSTLSASLSSRSRDVEKIGPGRHFSRPYVRP